MPQTPAVIIRYWYDLAYDLAFNTLVAAPLGLLGAFWPPPRQED